MLMDGDKILMSKRANSGYFDGFYSLCAGHVEENESVFDCMIREAKEEINIVVKAKDLKAVKVVHRETHKGKTYIDFFFTCTKWEGEIKINEPEKCSELLWVDINKLPTDTIPSLRKVLSNAFDDNLVIYIEE